MGNNSFRINNNLRSFQLDKEFMYYIHRLKELFRLFSFEFIWLWKRTLSDLNKMISSKDFNESYELFESVMDFFNSTHPTINLCIYQHQPFDNSLVLYRGDGKICLKKVFLNDLWEKKTYSIIKIDINDFKMINDTYGHIEWDVVLEQLWAILKTSVWVDDKACRDGWDEFLLLVDSLDLSTIEKIMERIHKRLEELNEKKAFPTHVSMGYCLYDATKSFIERVNLADEQMYAQKSESSQIYRLARKIASIKDADIFNELLMQIVKNTSSPGMLKQICKVAQLADPEN